MQKASLTGGSERFMDRRLALALSAILGGGCLAVWGAFYLQGRRYALRDHLLRADAIVSIAGTLGNINFIDGKADTAARLYHEGWAPLILFAGRWSHRAGQRESRLMSELELEAAVRTGRIDVDTAALAADSWDLSLDAEYMRERALRTGVPPDAILIECASLNTLENARFAAPLLAERGVRRAILVTSRFHQRRAYLTFTNVFAAYRIDLLNYYADTPGWRPQSWFLSSENRRLVRGEAKRIRTYGAKGDIFIR